ncbi:hypothetical protein KC332_g13721 [Hortaea werneckii]|uniref:DUF3844 domain-containing protein n=1 Tax=Hortaea werneckii EXF-2000 TaxID=1157616 RepID=A0A1Z5TTE1_HORWE|nr:hypothetical protein KC358_g13828 [Hortaea werneckii]OTA39297.1 hypothetical protein BTJ68_00662 [Hortaea werneckii EXF-2000]KAI6842598.1 hypothetical protein KC350_g5040 [Hortaea werneckii]KAI6936278.1 hypothetical protein KC348_g6064 [Hortaea werneckii]KAI6938924.1 hypothetical protein KC341_g4570 [Hortaea werneckii]
MRLATAAAAAFTSLISTAAADRAGHVYIIDQSSQPHSRDAADLNTLSPVSARLVLAQRAGVEDYHAADLESEGVLDAINEYGVKTPMFADGKDERRRKLNMMVLVEEAAEEDVEASKLNQHPSFAVSPAPGYTASRGLWIDLAKQSEPSIYGSLSDDEALEQLSKLPDSQMHDTFHIATSLDELQNLLSHEKIKKEYTITAYITPPGKYAQTGDGAWQWGSYSMPSTSADSQATLRKRSSSRPIAEAPLEDTSVSSDSSFTTHDFTAPVPAEEFHSNKKNTSTSPLPGILPQCFASLSACEETTRNCSGHGSCYKKFTDNSASDTSRYRDCYVCGCTATVKETSSDGGKTTTYWGGSACQKRDVSVEFWMLALFSIGFVFLISFAVGSVWEMGGEELPSVIGAGSTLENINSSTIHEISGFLDDNGEGSDGGRIPAGIIITGPSAPHSSIAEQLAKHKASSKPERIFVPLSSGSGSNLKALLKTLIQRGTSRGSALDDETDEVQTFQKKGAKLLNYDLQLLHDFVAERKLRQVVVTFDDTEAFDSDLLSELVELLGYWQDRIPFVLLFSVATSVDFLQQRLSREAIKCLDGRLFDVAPPGEVLEQMIDTITSTDPPIYIGPTVMGMALERQSDYIQSIDSFVDALKKVPKDHFEALRCTDSFQEWARRSLDDERTTEVKAALQNDLALLELVQQSLSEGQATLKGMMFAISVIRTLQQTLPNASVSPKSTLYVQAMTGKLPGSTMLRSLMLTVRKVPSDTAIKILKAVLSLDVEGHGLAECADIATDLDELLREQAGRGKPLRSEEDVRNSTLRTTVHAQKVELSVHKTSLSQQDKDFTSLLRRFTDTLQDFFTRTLINPKELPFNEIFVYDLRSPHREVFTPRPRHAVERARASPHDYLDCDCCAPEKESREEGEEEATLAATQPATAVLYQLYLESGNLINASDLWQAFQAVIGDDADEQQSMALFQRALAELRALGMVKSTRKRVDHIAKVAWRGL